MTENETKKPRAPRKDTTRIAAALEMAADGEGRFTDICEWPAPLDQIKDEIAKAEAAHAEKMRTLRAERDFASEIDPLTPDQRARVRAAIEA